MTPDFIESFPDKGGTSDGLVMQLDAATTRPAAANAAAEVFPVLQVIEATWFFSSNDWKHTQTLIPFLTLRTLHQGPRPVFQTAKYSWP